MPREFDAVVFDMDGVIFDSEIKVIECWKTVAQKYQIPDIETICLQCLGLTKEATLHKFLDFYGQEFPYTEYKKQVSALYLERYSEGRLPLKPGVHEVLSCLKENRKSVALASSNTSEYVVPELTEAGVIKYFDKIITGDMNLRSKPEPDLFLKACEELGTEPFRSYAVEDSHNGIRAAAAGGLMPVMIPDLAPVTEEIKSLCVEILPSLHALRDYLFF